MSQTTLAAQPNAAARPGLSTAALKMLGAALMLPDYIHEMFAAGAGGRAKAFSICIIRPTSWRCTCWPARCERRTSCPGLTLEPFHGL